MCSVESDRSPLIPINQRTPHCNDQRLLIPLAFGNLSQPFRLALAFTPDFLAVVAEEVS